MRNFSFLVAAAGIALIASPAQAVLVEFEYTGTVQNDPLADVRVGSPFNPSGQTSYTSPEFDFPFSVGDVLTFTYSALLDLNSTPPPANGIYRFNPLSPNASIGLRSIDGQNGAVSQYRPGPFLPGANINFLYDVSDGVADDQRFSIDISNGNFGDTLRMPGFYYDEANNIIAPGTAGRCNDFDREGCATVSVGTNAMTISSNFILGQVDPFTPPFRVGSFGDIQLDGQWSVPVITGDDPVDVPAPSALLLLGLGSGALVWRRKKRAANATTLLQDQYVLVLI